jgi:hypothetical protein
MKPTKSTYSGNPDRLARILALFEARNLSAESVAHLARCSLVEARVELRELVERKKIEEYPARVGGTRMFRRVAT